MLELRNSLVPINLLPMDVLLLIPMHLISSSDRLRVTFVCRRWRRAFVQHALLWSRLLLSEETDQRLLATFLELARRSPLDIFFDYSESEIISSMALLTPFAQQISGISADCTYHDDIRNLPAAKSGSLPLLHTLRIGDCGVYADSRLHSATVSPLFEGAVIMRNFAFYAHISLPPLHFAFPNLSIFRLWTREEFTVLPASSLLNFLEAPSPLLQEIEISIPGDISYKDVSPDKVLVLPCVGDFTLSIKSDEPDWEPATHLSCPFAKCAEFSYMPRSAHYGSNIHRNIYPPPPPLIRMFRHYTMGTVNQIDSRLVADEVLHCFVVFQPPSETSIQLLYIHPFYRKPR